VVIGTPAALTFLGFLGRWWWPLDLAANFRVQFALILLVVTGYCLFAKRWRAGLAASVPLLVNIACIVPLYLGPALAPVSPVGVGSAAMPPATQPVATTAPGLGPEGQAATTPTETGQPHSRRRDRSKPGQSQSTENPRFMGVVPDPSAQPGYQPNSDDPPAAAPGIRPAGQIRLLLVFLNTSQLESDELMAYIRDFDADVVVLHGVTNKWYTLLGWRVAPFRQIYAQPREDQFGLALLQRTTFRGDGPRINAGPVALSQGVVSVPAVQAEIEVDGQRLMLLGLHALPPTNPAYAAAHNAQFAGAARWARAQSVPTVVLGNLWATPWSPQLQTLMEDGHLVNSQQGYGIQSTWPAAGGLPFAKIPIDHCLHSAGLRTVTRKLGPVLDLDHQPLEVTLEWE